MDKLNKKMIYSILLIIFLIVIISLTFLFGRKKEKILAMYSINQEGRIRNEEEISEEIFDEYGNLTHYKYEKALEDGTIYEKEYNIKYAFDENKRIIKAEYDENYINIEYNDENQISKIINFTKDSNLEKEYTFTFLYNKDSTAVLSHKKYSYNGEDGYIINEKYTIKEVNDNNEKYSICTVSEDDVEKQIYTYKTLNKEVNNSNLFSLLNINFEGYITLIPTIENTNFTIEIPIFNCEKIVSFEDISDSYFNNGFSYNIFYDKNGNILKCDRVSNNQDIYYIYEKVSNKSHDVLMLDINNNQYNYLKYKDYLNANEVYKREILEKKTLSENEAKKMMTKFIEYFDSNK